MSKKRNSIVILNPIPGGMKDISPTRAEVMRQAGIGERHGDTFEFFQDCRERRVRQNDDEYDRQRQTGNADNQKFEIRIADGWRYPHTQWMRKSI
jgi:hypothetical protein